MFKKKLTKQLGCLALATSLVISGVYIQGTEEAKAKTTYFKKTASLSLKDKKGIKKVTVNGKKKKIKIGSKSVKLSFSKEGKYTVKITNKKGKTTKKVVIVDKTKPTIGGVKSGGVYANEVTVSASDKYGISSFTINGQKINSPYSVTLQGAGNCVAIAKDKAGNTRKVSFSIVEGVVETASPGAVSGGATSTSIPQVFPGMSNEDIPDKAPQTDCKHTWVLASAIKSPTCYSTGTGKYVCTSCYGTKQEVIPKVEHSYTQISDDAQCCKKKATCTESGEYYKICEFCGKVSTVWERVPSLGHDWRKKATTEYLKESASESHGDIYYLACDRCGEKSTETWDNGRKSSHTIHTFTDTSVTTNENLANEATCTEPQRHYYKCTGCDTFSTKDTFITKEALGHDFQSSTKKIIEEANCEHGNIYVTKCSRCDVTTSERADDGAKSEHIFSVESDVVASPATCTKVGTYYYKCANCGKSAKGIDESKVFSGGQLANHQYTEKTSESYFKEGATCQHAKLYYKSCVNCGQSSEGTKDEQTFEVGSRANCSYVDGTSKARYDEATCQHGNIYYKQCKWCGNESYDECEKLRKAGHKETSSKIQDLLWDDGKRVDHAYQHIVLDDFSNYVSPATCEKGAGFMDVCCWCYTSNKATGGFYIEGDLATRYPRYAALGHDMSVHINETAATETQDGTYQLKCSRGNCGHIDNTVHTGQTHTDVHSPAIWWHYQYGTAGYALECSKWDQVPFVYYGSLQPGDGCQRGTLSIRIDDTYGGRPSCQLSKAYAILDGREGDYTSEYLSKFSNPNYRPEQNESEGIYFVWGDPATGVKTANLDLNLDFTNPVLNSKYWTSGCYIYIYAEDIAGNINCVRTPNLYK